MRSKSVHLAGHGVSLITPFNSAGEVDYPALEGLINFIAQSRVSFISILGTASESNLLSLDERIRVLDFVSEINKGRKPLVGGIAASDTRTAVQRISTFKRRDFVAIICFSPLPEPSSVSGFVGHFRSLAQASDLPIIIENGRSFVDTNRINGILELANESRIIGVMDGSGDIGLHGTLLRRRPSGFLVFSSRDALAMPLMALGIDGVISSIGNAFPDAYSDMVDQLIFGSLLDAREIHHQLAPLMRILEQEGTPTGIKAVLKHLHYCKNHVRLPNTPVSESTMSAIYQALADLPQAIISPVLPEKPMT